MLEAKTGLTVGALSYKGVSHSCAQSGKALDDNPQFNPSAGCLYCIRRLAAYPSDAHPAFFFDGGGQLKSRAVGVTHLLALGS